MYQVQHVDQQKHATRTTIATTEIPAFPFAIVLLGTAIILWAVLFTEFPPPLHDTFHTLRHSLYAIPCH
jgi:hypothetical protein